MELEKRKREDDGGAKGKRAKAQEDDNAVEGMVQTPRDEEVEEFYAILKRIQVAVRYFQDRNGGRLTDRDLTAKTWSPSFVPEDFEGVKRADPAESPEENQNAGLDLNSDPVSDVSDSSA